MTIAAETRRDVWERRFFPSLIAATALAAAIRLYYVLTDDRWVIRGDGFDYFLSALRLADGGGYTRAWGQIGAPAAYHPPGWTTLLGGVAWLGGRTLRTHQLVGVVLGLGVVVLAGLIGRRYFDARVGVIAALIAAAYPGFWLLEGNVLAEPLALFVLGVLMLLVADLRDRPTLLRSGVAGVVCGLLTLVRSEQLMLLVLVVVPIVWLSSSLRRAERLARIAVAGLACLAVLAPWSIYNSARFGAPVFVSTGDGHTLLAGNCDPGSFRGENLGFVDTTCYVRLGKTHPQYDEARLNNEARRSAIANVRDNLTRMPVVVAARLGRTLAVYRPGATVKWVSDWMLVGRLPVWTWVVSFWFVLAFATVGVVLARRHRIWTWPLLAPAAIALFETVVFYGEPRYHSMADLGLIVLAAYGIVRLIAWRPRPAPADEAVPA